ncbi:MAG: DUF3107 domain-containing protein [Actinomycetaceae bacterium]|nr:DUF3107 domain-containing protein [Actinomycetaceae bacterium]
MQVTIGILHSNRELSLETNESSSTIYTRVEEAQKTNTPLHLTDTQGKELIVPINTLAYIEIKENKERRVGFGL